MNRGLSVLTWGTSPVAMLAYYGVQWLQDNDPEHPLLRLLERCVGRIAGQPKDPAQRRGGTGHFLVLVGPDRCRCGNEWPCMDSVAADRLTRQI